MIVKVLTALETKFAVRSGGHKPTPGFNSIGSNGVLLALQNLNTLSLSSDLKTVSVGTGNRWSAVYEYIEPHGITVAGGREPMVGVGGFLLGGIVHYRWSFPVEEADVSPCLGGVNLFVNSWGLGLDLVSRFEVLQSPMKLLVCYCWYMLTLAGRWC